MKLDKKLDRILYNIDLPATGKLINVQEWQKNQIKTVILEALKAEMPKETKVEGNVHYDASAAYNAGINHGVSDCLEVCNRLLGDEDAKG